jgi:16S rRNA (cytosine967-C5)-methyltransferase
MAKAQSPRFDPVRMLAWHVLDRIDRSQAFTDPLFDQALAKENLKALDRATLWELVLGTLRWRGRLDPYIVRALRSPQKKMNPGILSLLRLGAYQILCLDRTPDSAAVDEAVRLARERFKDPKISGFVNAVLRSIARHKDQDPFPPFSEDPVEFISQAASHPRWMVERWVKEFGVETARAICEANNQRPPVTGRVNTLKMDRDRLLEKLAESGSPGHSTPFSPEGFTFVRSPLFAGESLFRQGFYFIQDEASQMVPHLLRPQPGERILDACAAPGGKSTHLAQLMKNRGEIIALDLQETKLERIRQNCQRLGVQIIRPCRGDATQPLPFPPEIIFDRILVDAPCSGLGILHRHPETKWRRKPEDILRLQKLQTLLLDNVSSRLKPGGCLVYSTCTMTPEENDSVAEFFLQKHPDFQREDLAVMLPDAWRPLIDGRGFFRTYPEMVAKPQGERLDGFFAALFHKQAGMKRRL